MARFGPPIRVGSGRATVQLDDTMSRIVRNVLENSAPLVLQELEAERDRLLREGRRDWPKKTGRSVAGFERTLRIFPTGAFEVGITNPVQYTYWVRARRHQGRRSWDVVFSRPGRKAGRKLAERLASELAELAVR